MTPGPGWRSAASWGPDTQTQGFSWKVKVLISPAPAQHRVKCPTVIASAIHQMCDVFNLISLTLISAPRPPGSKNWSRWAEGDPSSPLSRSQDDIGSSKKVQIQHRDIRDEGSDSWPQSHRDTCYRKWFAQRLLVIFIGVEHLGFKSRVEILR